MVEVRKITTSLSRPQIACFLEPCRAQGRICGNVLTNHIYDADVTAGYLVTGATALAIQGQSRSSIYRDTNASNQKIGEISASHHVLSLAPFPI
jgi:hypothetical protein